jgi:choline dehydrogenase-like flavoprotein
LTDYRLLRVPVNLYERQPARQESAVDTEVVIAGAGPAGPMLARELRRCDVWTVALERRRERDDRLRGENIMRLSAQALDRYQLLKRLDGAQGKGLLPGHLPPVMAARQRLVEQILEKRAVEPSWVPIFAASTRSSVCTRATLP